MPGAAYMLAQAQGFKSSAYDTQASSLHEASPLAGAQLRRRSSARSGSECCFLGRQLSSSTAPWLGNQPGYAYQLVCCAASTGPASMHRHPRAGTLSPSKSCRPQQWSQQFTCWVLSGQRSPPALPRQACTQDSLTAAAHARRAHLPGCAMPAQALACRRCRPSWPPGSTPATASAGRPGSAPGPRPTGRCPRWPTQRSSPGCTTRTAGRATRSTPAGRSTRWALG